MHLWVDRGGEFYALVMDDPRVRFARGPESEVQFEELVGICRMG